MRPKIPWGRLTAEGSVIVVSILLAFAIQAWWEGQQERRQEVEYLTALRAELEEGRRRIPRANNSIRSTLDSHEALVRQFPGDSLASPDSLVYWLANIAQPNNFAPPTAVLDDLVSSGGVQTIRADPIRLAIADYQLALEGHLTNLDQAWAIWSERIQPFLEARVSRVDRLREGPYANATREEVPFAPSPFAPDYRGLFSDRVFESMLAERWIRLNETARALGRIDASASAVLLLIEQELDPA